MSRYDLLTANDVEGAYPQSYYAATATPLDPFPMLQDRVDCDVCIIGAGYTGLSAALHLAQAGVDVVLLEAHRVGWGASGRNGGQAGTGQRVGIGELQRQYGRDTARTLWRIAEDAKVLVKQLISEHDIDCSYKPGDLHCMHKARYLDGAKRYVDLLNRDYDYPAIRFVPREEMREMLGTDAYHGGTLDSGAGHLHPLNFALGLARAARDAGVRIFEASRVESYTAGSPCRIATKQGRVSAQTLVLACNGYLGGLDSRVAARVMPINNFIIATEPLGKDGARALIRDDIAVSDSRFVINYYRLSDDNRLLFGGGENYGYKFPSDIKSFVRRPMLEIYPQLKEARIDYGWGGTLAITMNRLPHIARLGANVVTSSGYSGQGVTLATMAGKLLCQTITGTSPGFDAMAKLPTPKFPGGTLMRSPLLALAMTWYALRDRM